MKFTAVIVDDEKFAREDLKNVIAEFSSIKIVGEAGNVSDAAKLISAVSPDLVFLDIKMKGEIGFELLGKINPGVKIIFVTAFDEYAVRAFEVNALDYLLKPVNPDRLKLTLEKLETDETDVVAEAPLEMDDSIFIQLNNTHRFLKIAEISIIESAADYTEVILLDHTRYITSKPMREWEERLPPKYFCRIHRSTIVNIGRIEMVEEWFNNSYSVKMKGIEKPYNMSRNYASRIKKIFK